MIAYLPEITAGGRRVTKILLCCGSKRGQKTTFNVASMTKARVRPIRHN